MRRCCHFVAKVYTLASQEGGVVNKKKVSLEVLKNRIVKYAIWFYTDDTEGDVRIRDAVREYVLELHRLQSAKKR